MQRLFKFEAHQTEFLNADTIECLHDGHLLQKNGNSSIPLIESKRISCYAGRSPSLPDATDGYGPDFEREAILRGSFRQYETESSAPLAVAMTMPL